MCLIAILWYEKSILVVKEVGILPNPPSPVTSYAVYDTRANTEIKYMNAIYTHRCLQWLSKSY